MPAVNISNVRKMPHAAACLLAPFLPSSCACTADLPHKAQQPHREVWHKHPRQGCQGKHHCCHAPGVAASAVAADASADCNDLPPAGANGTERESVKYCVSAYPWIEIASQQSGFCTGTHLSLRPTDLLLLPPAPAGVHQRGARERQLWHLQVCGACPARAVW